MHVQKIKNNLHVCRSLKPFHENSARIVFSLDIGKGVRVSFLGRLETPTYTLEESAFI